MPCRHRKSGGMSAIISLFSSVAFKWCLLKFFLLRFLIPTETWDCFMIVFCVHAVCTWTTDFKFPYFPHKFSHFFFIQGIIFNVPMLWNFKSISKGIMACVYITKWEIENDRTMMVYGGKLTQQCSIHIHVFLSRSVCIVTKDILITAQREKKCYASVWLDVLRHDNEL